MANAKLKNTPPAPIMSNTDTAPVENVMTPEIVAPAVNADVVDQIEALKAEGEKIESDRKAALVAVDEKYKPLLDEYDTAKKTVNTDFAQRVNANSKARQDVAEKLFGERRKAIAAQLEALKVQEAALLGGKPSAEAGTRGGSTDKVLSVLTADAQSIQQVTDKVAPMSYGSVSNILRNLATAGKIAMVGEKGAPRYASTPANKY